jgi:hypothetical protein
MGGTPSTAPQLALIVRDPLSLGYTRPAPLPDPEPFDEARDRAEYTYSLLNEKESKELDDDMKEFGALTIDKVREIFTSNSIKNTQHSRGEMLALDPEVMMLVDMRYRDKVFIAGDEIYTRAELMEAFAFPEFGVTPEAVFEQQEIGVFPAGRHAIDDNKLEYVARDAGDTSIEFTMIEDLVGRVARKNYRDSRSPLKIAKTKIFVGREKWEDFQHVSRFFRGGARIAMSRMLTAGSEPGGAAGPNPIFDLARMLGGGSRNSVAAIEDSGAASRRAEAAATALQLREEEAAKREEEARLREEATRLREEALRSKEEEYQRRIDADMKRIEAMVARMAAPQPAAATPPAATAPPAPTNGSAVNSAVEGDSVSL